MRLPADGCHVVLAVDDEGVVLAQAQGSHLRLLKGDGSRKKNLYLKFQ